MDQNNLPTVENTLINIHSKMFNDFMTKITRRLKFTFHNINYDDASTCIHDAIMIYRAKYQAGLINEPHSLSVAKAYIYTIAKNKYLKIISPKPYINTKEKNQVVNLNHAVPITDEHHTLKDLDTEALLNNIFEVKKTPSTSKSYGKSFDLSKYFEDRIEIGGIFKGKDQQKKAILLRIKHPTKNELEIATLLNISYESFRQNYSRGKKTIQEHMRQNQDFWDEIM